MRCWHPYSKLLTLEGGEVRGEGGEGARLIKQQRSRPFPREVSWATRSFSFKAAFPRDWPFPA